MDETRFWILASKKIAADISPDELAELELLFIQNPELNELLYLIEPNQSTKSSLSMEEEDRVLRNLRSKLAFIEFPATVKEKELYHSDAPKEYTKKGSWNQGLRLLLMSIAGITFIILFISFLRQSPPSKKGGSENKIATRPGSRSQVKLPDGTMVTLNADSKLTYPDNFVGNTREVTLEGEAFFEVTENKLRPFIIHSKMMDIKVLGTVFNVKSYPSESIAEASLIRGSIEVTLKERHNQKIMLKPNEKISVSHGHEDTDILSPNAAKNGLTRPIYNEPLISVAQLTMDRKENIIREIGWTENKLMFQNETLEAIAVSLERWYGQSVLIRSETLKGKMFTGNFHGENLRQVLEALQASYNFSIRNENNSWVIY